MNDSPYRVGTEHNDAAAARNNSVVFWAGIVLVVIGLIGMSYAIFSMNSVFQQVAAPIPTPMKPSEIARNFTSYRLIGIASFVMSLCGLMTVVYAFRKLARTPTSSN